MPFAFLLLPSPRAFDDGGRGLRDVVADALFVEARGEGRLGGDVDACVVGRRGCARRGAVGEWGFDVDGRAVAGGEGLAQLDGVCGAVATGRVRREEVGPDPDFFGRGPRRVALQVERDVALFGGEVERDELRLEGNGRVVAHARGGC